MSIYVSDCLNKLILKKKIREGGKKKEGLRRAAGPAWVLSGGLVGDGCLWVRSSSLGSTQLNSKPAAHSIA